MSYVTKDGVRVFFSIMESSFVTELPNSIEDWLDKEQKDS